MVLFPEKDHGNPGRNVSTLRNTRAGIEWDLKTTVDRCWMQNQPSELILSTFLMIPPPPPPPIVPGFVNDDMTTNRMVRKHALTLEATAFASAPSSTVNRKAHHSAQLWAVRSQDSVDTLVTHINETHTHAHVHTHTSGRLKWIILLRALLMWLTHLFSYVGNAYLLLA